MKYKISSYSIYEKKANKGIFSSLLIFGGIIDAILIVGGITAAVVLRNQWLFNSGCSETNNYNTDVKTDDIASLINTTITVTGTTPETNNSITRVTTDYIVNIESATDMAVIEIKLFL